MRSAGKRASAPGHGGLDRGPDRRVDLGHHPGKDRLPREAALAGCVTVVGRAGAAVFADEVAAFVETFVRAPAV